MSPTKRTRATNSPPEASVKRKPPPPPQRRSPRKAAQSSNPNSLTRADTLPVAASAVSDAAASRRPPPQRQPTGDSVRSSDTDVSNDPQQLDTEQAADDDTDEESQRLQQFFTSRCSVERWRRLLEEFRPVPNLNRQPYPCPPRPGHAVLFRIDNFYQSERAEQAPQPHPAEFADKWDANHVRMPCSPQNAVRWSVIDQSLARLRPDAGSPSVGIDDLAAVLNECSCSSHSRSGMCLDSLNCLLMEELDKKETRHFLNKVLPGMARLALALPHLVTQPPPLLRCGQQRKVTMSQLQAASLLSNAFFSTFPRRSSASREYANFPSINFSSLFASGSPSGSGCPRRVEKLKCLFNYFQRVTTNNPVGVLTFSRRVLNERINWASRIEKLPQLLAASEGTIEDDGCGMLEVDFANAYIGGGVLGRGLVQEEIRFLICPELLLSRLLAEALEDGEALWITGAERFSNYTGYSSTFQWNGDHKDERPRDSNRRLVTKVVAMDARCYGRGVSGYREQFSKSAIDRELHKALVGFGGLLSAKKNKKQQRRPVATGNWGCGAFGGDLQLKSLLQLMACGVAGRSCVYFTFGSSEFQAKLEQFHRDCLTQGLTIGQLYQRLMAHSKLVRSAGVAANSRADLFRWLLLDSAEPSKASAARQQSLVDYDYDTDDTEATTASRDGSVMTDDEPAHTAEAASGQTLELPQASTTSANTLLVHQDDDLRDLVQAESELNDATEDPPSTSDIRVDPI